MYIDNNGTNLPDFFLLGAAKSGTTSLYYMLSDHQDIAGPDDYKEPGYFMSFEMADLAHKSWSSTIVDFNKYVGIFSDLSTKLVFEATPEYLYNITPTIQKIKDVYGEKFNALKFVIILRDPIERIFSHYRMHVRDALETLPFEKAIKAETISERLKRGIHPTFDYTGFSKYGSQLKRLFSLVEARQVKVVYFEKFFAKPDDYLDEIYSFLGVPSCGLGVKVHFFNKSGSVRWRQLYNYLFIHQGLLKKIARIVIPNRQLQALKFVLQRWCVKEIEIPLKLPDDVLAMIESEFDILAASNVYIPAEWQENLERQRR